MTENATTDKINTKKVIQDNFAFPCEWFPSIDDLDRYIYPNPQKYTSFILFVLKESEKMKLTLEQREVRQELQEIICKLTELKT